MTDVSQELELFFCFLFFLVVAGELCKLARVTGPEFPHPFSLSSRTLPASDWPVPRGGIKYSACPVCGFIDCP